jgi:hypothetical protein
MRSRVLLFQQIVKMDLEGLRAESLALPGNGETVTALDQSEESAL